MGDETKTENRAGRVYVLTRQSGGILQDVAVFADYDVALGYVRAELMKDESPVDWTAETADDGLVYEWYKWSDEDGDIIRVEELPVLNVWPPPEGDKDGDYITPGNDPSMPGGGPPVYHGPEERYGA